MESYQHALISAVISPLLLFYVFGISGMSMILLSAYGVFIGVFIDLDHFLMQRILNGNWDDVKKTVENPVKMVFDNMSLRTDPIEPWSRLLSHFAILALFPAAIYIFDTALAEFSFLILFAHILCDLYAGWRNDKLLFH